MNSLDRCHPAAALRLASAVLLLGGFLQDAVAFGGVGLLSECPSFSTCTAELRSNANAAVVKEVTGISPGYTLPAGLSPGTTIRRDPVTTNTTAPIRTGDDPAFLPVAGTPFGAFAFARAQTDFGTNRGAGSTTLGARGIDRQGSGSALIEVRTSALAQSAWRDVFTFSTSGHYHADIAIDGHTASHGNTFPSSFEVLGHAASAIWSYALDVWDVTRLLPDPDGFLAPALVASINDGGVEQRSSFASVLGLDFDFLAGNAYVITSRLETSATNNRAIDMFNTVSLRNVALSNGASLSALSGHDYFAQVAPVPEPSTWLLFAGGLAAMARIAQRRRRDA